MLGIKLKSNLTQIKRFKKLTLEEKRLKLINDLKRNPHHQWIMQSTNLQKIFYQFFYLLDAKAIHFLYQSCPLIFLQPNGKLSCTLTSKKEEHIIIIFPDLYKLLLSGAFFQGYAILAHEIGHLILEHSKQKLTMMETQYQADTYVHQLGLGDELLQVLSEFSHLPECQMRINYLKKLSEK